ncbi:DNA-3-methyladenine glycosylase [Marivirga tractuosa]|uniref:Putative 3-methyladenine DNA glycosylase n=1 Tax=Marivirga tractuosa (strain ATCC 23168 / DSM 4126 / NBRC 15989 / NCIMB 1408 / VKM B-1430 / H-43) TaxID=643867 RepID=E4TKH5_MARTH|nr:DNA-3-methyladenine glycosylase [Marivirga tractuosa]ADR20155.1 DNA-3-methyladenine glycosylase [Marivirga tractuosa DSM 4126]BDD15404.1 DNA-3-methyladenine glycosylase [Marivirga tractuosa]
MKVAKKRLERSLFLNSNVVELAQRLLGKLICTNINGVYCEAIITETEAYSGENDKACHAHMGRFTNRTATMYEEGGTAYIYLCYGIHHLFNVVSNVKGKADAVLIRSVEPVEGIEKMLERRNSKSNRPKIYAGPGKLCQALGIDKSLNGVDLVNSNVIYLADSDIDAAEIIKTTRIGIDYAEEDALLPWRFYFSGNKYVSKYK